MNYSNHSLVCFYFYYINRVTVCSVTVVELWWSDACPC